MIRNAGAIIILCFTLFLFVSCSNQYASPTKTFETYVAAVKAGDKDAMEACFTKESIELMKKVEEKSKEFDPDADTEKKDWTDENPFKDSETTIKNEKIDGDKATLAVEVDKMDMDLLFLKEGGKWKMDSSKQMQMALDGMEQMMKLKSGMKGFLKGFKSGDEESEESEESEE